MTDCRCIRPQLILDAHDGSVRCFHCGSSARADLGGSDDLERVRYRAELNRYRERSAGVALVPVDSMTPRQRLIWAKEQRKAEALRMKAAGLSNGQIAYKLGVSTVTVRTYVNPAYAESAKASRERARKKNPEKYRQRKRAYVAANLERERERKRIWRAQNAERVAAYNRKWRSEHPEYREREVERNRRRREAARVA